MPPTLHLLDDASWASLRPLTWLRPVAELRVGTLTAADRWRRAAPAGAQVGYLTQSYLGAAFPAHLGADNLVVNAAALPHDGAAWLRELALDEAVISEGRFLAARLGESNAEQLWRAAGDLASVPTLQIRDHSGEVTYLRRPHDLFTVNGDQLRRDFDALTRGRTSAAISPTVTVLGNGGAFLEEGTECEAAILDTREGPIYLGKSSVVMPGALLRGPLSIGEGAVVKMGGKVYGGTTVGPYCKVGGELQNVVFQGFANKGHDGYLGNAVIGRWCNLGADANASNLKNNYAPVRTWDYAAERFLDTGLQFCGLVMGDHVKCGINAMFNTGTVVGTAANVFGAGFPRAFVPDFSWGGASGFTTYRLDKALETVERVVARRGLTLAQPHRDALAHVFAATATHRRGE